MVHMLNCPKCGEQIKPESIGWKCEKCKGFVDMDNVFHEHVEKPFLPPMRNCDKIRSMSDEQLALIMVQISDLDSRIPFCMELPECQKLLDTDDGIPIEKCAGCMLKWLQKPAEED